MPTCWPSCGGCWSSILFWIWTPPRRSDLCLWRPVLRFCIFLWRIISLWASGWRGRRLLIFLWRGSRWFLWRFSCWLILVEFCVCVSLKLVRLLLDLPYLLFFSILSIIFVSIRRFHCWFCANWSLCLIWCMCFSGMPLCGPFVRFARWGFLVCGSWIFFRNILTRIMRIRFRRGVRLGLVGEYFSRDWNRANLSWFKCFLVNVEAFYYINYTLYSHLASKYNKVILLLFISLIFHSISRHIFNAFLKGHLMIIDRLMKK